MRRVFPLTATLGKLRAAPGRHDRRGSPGQHGPDPPTAAVKAMRGIIAKLPEQNRHRDLALGCDLRLAPLG